jgi:hypothetical protein
VGTRLRPEARAPHAWEVQTIVPRDEALRLLYKAVAKRRSLIHGRLSKEGKYCAIGALGANSQPDGINLLSEFVDEVAAVNDALGPRSSPRRRWAYVMRWLRKQIAILDSEANRGTVK